MTTGMIVRADSGGLGTQSQCAWRHLHPDRTLIIHDELKPRGRAKPERYINADHTSGIRQANARGNWPDSTLGWLSDCDSVLTFECTYDHRLGQALADKGHRLIVQANPELWSDAYRPAEVILPTLWEKDRIPGARVVPVPVARDRLPYHHRSVAKRFLHVAAPAMLDRNGTEIVLRALPYIESEITLVLRVGQMTHDNPVVGNLERAGQVGRVTVEVVRDQADEYWQVYANTDVLVLPRRYGGLSLPMQEAASLGMPVISLALEPQARWAHVMGILPTSSTPHRMKGGTFEVYDASPRSLAMAIDTMADDPKYVGGLSRAADHVASKLAWPMWEGVYRRLLAGRTKLAL